MNDAPWSPGGGNLARGPGLASSSKGGMSGSRLPGQVHQRVGATEAAKIMQRGSYGDLD